MVVQDYHLELAHGDEFTVQCLPDTVNSVSVGFSEAA